MPLHPLEYETLQVIRERALLQPGDRVVLGVSGGVDSMALLQVMAALRSDLDLKLTAVYVEHGLRPGESAAEACLVAARAAALGVAFRTGVIPVRERARKNGASLEAAGRELRYGFLREVAEDLGGATIAVAHQADDQAEEILLRLLRGSGRAGLAGMSWRNRVGVIRPLLGFAKVRLQEYLRELGGHFLEDGSNTDHRFLRNRVRLELLPLLEERFNPAVRDNLHRTAEVLGAEEELLDGLARQALSRVQVGPRHPEEAGAPGEVHLDQAALHREELALQRRVLELVLIDLATPVTYRALENLRIFSHGTAGELHLPGGLRVTLEAGLLRFRFPAGRGGGRGRLAPVTPEANISMIPGPGLWPLSSPGPALLVERLEQRPTPGELRSEMVDFLDAERISFPLQVRPARPGDRFHPLGGPGRRKVADFLNDRKLPHEVRRRVLVLESGGRIVALVGLRIDDSCRVRERTAAVLKVSLIQ